MNDSPVFNSDLSLWVPQSHWPQNSEATAAKSPSLGPPHPTRCQKLSDGFGLLRTPKVGHSFAIHWLAILASPGGWSEMQHPGFQPWPAEWSPHLTGPLVTCGHMCLWSAGLHYSHEGTAEPWHQLACDLGQVRTYFRASVFSFVKWRSKTILRWLQNQANHSPLGQMSQPCPAPSLSLCSVTKSSPTLCNPIGCSPQAPLSIGFLRQECWSGLPFPTPGDLPNPGIEPTSPVSPALAGRLFNAEPPGKSLVYSLAK